MFATLLSYNTWKFCKGLVIHPTTTSYVGNLRRENVRAWRGVVLGPIFLWEVLFLFKVREGREGGRKGERERGREGRGVVVLMILYMYIVYIPWWFSTLTHSSKGTR
jgi:hypothetical protein